MGLAVAVGWALAEAFLLLGVAGPAARWERAAAGTGAATTSAVQVEHESERSAP